MADPTTTDPDKYKVIFENERVRVLEYRDEPGQATQPHSHPDSLMYTLSSFDRRLVADDGASRDVSLAAGEVRWLDAQVHSGENIGRSPTHVLFVELKERHSRAEGLVPDTRAEMSADGVTADDLAALERKRLRALVDADLGVAEALHAADFQLITPGGASLSKDEYLQGIASGDIDYLVWEPETIDSLVRADAGCLRYRSTIHMRFDGQEASPARYWHTDYYEKRAAGWQVVWSQATRAAPV